jgi:hypothetical protein
MCDGIPHCSDGYDEMNCTYPRSTGEQFLVLVINNAFSILVSSILTVTDSCSVSSDVFTCSTSSTFIHLICISNDRVCDG